MTDVYENDQNPEHWHLKSDDIVQQKFSFSGGKNAKWYSLFGRQFGSFLQN